MLFFSNVPPSVVMVAVVFTIASPSNIMILCDEIDKCRSKNLNKEFIQMTHSIFSFKQIMYIRCFCFSTFSTHSFTTICNDLNSPFDKFLYCLVFKFYLMDIAMVTEEKKNKKRRRNNENISIKRTNIQSHTLNERCKKRPTNKRYRLRGIIYKAIRNNTPMRVSHFVLNTRTHTVSGERGRETKLI